MTRHRESTSRCVCCGPPSLPLPLPLLYPYYLLLSSLLPQLSSHITLRPLSLPHFFHTALLSLPPWNQLIVTILRTSISTPVKATLWNSNSRITPFIRSTLSCTRPIGSEEVNDILSAAVQNRSFKVCGVPSHEELTWHCTFISSYTVSVSTFTLSALLL